MNDPEAVLASGADINNLIGKKETHKAELLSGSERMYRYISIVIVALMPSLFLGICGGNYSLQARQWSEKVIRRIERPDWLVRDKRIRKEVHMMVTPRVVEEVRLHFNCSTLEGAELEDQGGEGKWYIL